MQRHDVTWLHRNSSNFRITISWNYNPQSTNRYLQFSVNGWNQQLSLVALLSQEIFYENQDLAKLAKSSFSPIGPITKNATWKLLPSALVMPSLFLDPYHQGHRHHDRLRGPEKEPFQREMSSSNPQFFRGDVSLSAEGCNPSTRGRQFIPQVCRLSHMPKCRI